MTAHPRIAAFRRLALEALVIVGSILLAFALDAGWDTRRERREAAAALESLRSEFETARSEIAFYIGLDTRIFHAVETTLAALREGLGTGRAFVTVPDTALAWLFITPTFEPLLSTLDGLIASGRLGLIREGELRGALARWPATLEEATEEDRGSLEYARNHLDPVFRREMDVTPFRSLAEPLGDGELDPALMAGSSRVPVSNEIAGVLASRFDILRHGLHESAAVREEIDRILALIGHAQGR